MAKYPPAILAFALACFYPPVVHAFNEHEAFDITADMITYADADQTMTAEGHVVVLQGASTLTADQMRFERLRGYLFAKGHVTLNDKGTFLIGEMLDYDLRMQQGRMTGAMGYRSPWLIQASNWEKQLDYYAGRSASFTSCDFIDPHYHIRSTRVHLVPGQYFWAWNNLAYLDTLPIIYSPFIYKNMAKQNVVFQIQPGHDSVNGNFAKTQTTVRFTDLAYDRILLDHYTVLGTGFGNEFDYSAPGKTQGSLFGYFIHPHESPDLPGSPQVAQYTVRSYHWQRLNPTTTLQSNVRWQPNISFNNQFFPQDTNQSVTDTNNSVALTQQTSRINQRLVIDSLESPDPNDASPFARNHVQTASLPRYDLTLYQRPLWNPLKPTAVNISTGPLAGGATSAFSASPVYRQSIGPILYSMSASVGDIYQRLDDRAHNNALAAFNLSDAIPLGRRWSFTPTVTPQLSWQDKFNARPQAPSGSATPVNNAGVFRGFQGRLGTSDTLRWRPLSSLTLDQTYALTERLEPNSAQLDRSVADGGVETHHVGWIAVWRPSFKYLLRSFSGYDLRRIADEDPHLYLQRKWDPWTNELTLEPRKSIRYFFRYQLAFYPTRASLWEADYRYAGLYRTRLQTGFLFNNGAPGRLTWNNDIGIYFSPSWRVDAMIHTLIPNTSFTDATQQGSIIDSEFIVTRDLHCWQMQFVYRNRPPFGTEYSVLFNLKLGVAAGKAITNTELESQYYPWRAHEYAN